MKGRKNIYKDNTNGFQKNPQNINRTGANRGSISKFLKEIGEKNIVSFEIILETSDGKKQTRKAKLDNKMSNNELLANLLWFEALTSKNKLQAMEKIMDRLEGKPKQEFEVESKTIEKIVGMQII